MRPKKECDKCGRTYNKRTLHKHKPTGKLRCYNCTKRYGQNKFYAPEIPGGKKKKPYLKLSYSMQEKQYLFGLAMRHGISYEDAITKVNRSNEYQKAMQKLRTRKNKEFKPSSIKTNKEFLKGLGQAKK